MKMPLIFLLLLLSVYPAALLVNVGVDSYFGDHLFADSLAYGSNKALAETVMRDWAYSCIWVLPVMVIASLLMKLVPKAGRIVAVTGAAAALLATFVSGDIPLMLGLTIMSALIASLIFRGVAAT